MKNLILTAVAMGVVGLSVPSAHAGDSGWATAGKVLTGVAAGVIIAKAVDGPPAYASVSYGYAAPGYAVSYRVGPAPVYAPPPTVIRAPATVVIRQPVVYAPAPVIVHQPVYCAPTPAYTVIYNHSSRGHAYGHHPGRGHGRR